MPKDPSNDAEDIDELCRLIATRSNIRDLMPKTQKASVSVKTRILPVAFIVLITLSLSASAVYSYYQFSVPVKISIFKNIMPGNQSITLTPTPIGGHGRMTVQNALIINTLGHPMNFTVKVVGNIPANNSIFPLSKVFSKFMVVIQNGKVNITRIDAVSSQSGRITVNTASNLYLTATFEWIVKPDLKNPVNPRIWILVS